MSSAESERRQRAEDLRATAPARIMNGSSAATVAFTSAPATTTAAAGRRGPANVQARPPTIINSSIIRSLCAPPSA